MNYSEFIDDLAVIAKYELVSILEKKIEPSINKAKKCLKKDFNDVLDRKIEEDLKQVLKGFLVYEIKSKVREDNNYLVFLNQEDLLCK